MQPSLNPPEEGALAPPPPRKRRMALQWQDIVALVVVAIVAYKLLIAPRIFENRIVAAPPISASMLDGPAFSLAAQRDHVVFLDFWASWCEPCKLSLPLVEHYAHAHPGSRVYTVNVGEPVDVVRTFARDHNLDRVILDPQQDIAAQFGVTAFPTMVVIDAKGFVRAKWLGLNPAIGAAMSNAEASLK